MHQFLKFHLVPSSKQVPLSVWHVPVAVCTVLNSWRWMERPSETCRVSFQNKIKFEKLVHLVAFTIEMMLKLLHTPFSGPRALNPHLNHCKRWMSCDCNLWQQTGVSDSQSYWGRSGWVWFVFLWQKCDLNCLEDICVHVLRELASLCHLQLGEGLSVVMGATCRSCAASDVEVLTFKWPGWCLNFSAWCMKTYYNRDNKVNP